MFLEHRRRRVERIGLAVEDDIGPVPQICHFLYNLPLAHKEQTPVIGTVTTICEAVDLYPEVLYAMRIILATMQQSYGSNGEVKSMAQGWLVGHLHVRSRTINS